MPGGKPPLPWPRGSRSPWRPRRRASDEYLAPVLERPVAHHGAVYLAGSDPVLLQPHRDGGQCQLCPPWHAGAEETLARDESSDEPGGITGPPRLTKGGEEQVE